jgi:hypothetical protein
MGALRASLVNCTGVPRHRVEKVPGFALAVAAILWVAWTSMRGSMRAVLGAHRFDTG